jgi:hypothetical protein
VTTDQRRLRNHSPRSRCSTFVQFSIVSRREVTPNFIGQTKLLFDSRTSFDRIIDGISISQQYLLFASLSGARIQGHLCKGLTRTTESHPCHTERGQVEQPKSIRRAPARPNHGSQYLQNVQLRSASTCFTPPSATSLTKRAAKSTTPGQTRNSLRGRD